MDFSVEDFAEYAANEGINLPGDESTTQQLKMFQVQESYRSKRLEAASNERKWWWGKVFAIVTVLVTAGTAGWTQVRAPAPDPVEAAAVVADDVVEEVDAAVEGLEARVDDVEGRVGNVEEGVSASIELQLQQSEESRRMLIDAMPARERGKYREKGATLKRAESRAVKAAVAVDTGE